MGHLRVTIGHLKANTTELHPKVRQTCYIIILWLQVHGVADWVITGGRVVVEEGELRGVARGAGGQ